MLAGVQKASNEKQELSNMILYPVTFPAPTCSVRNRAPSSATSVVLIRLLPLLMSALITLRDVISSALVRQEMLETACAAVVMTINLPRVAMQRVDAGWATRVLSNHRQGDNCFCAGEEKGQEQSRSTLVNHSPHALRADAECCTHRLCLSSLFGSWVLNGVGYVFNSVGRYVPVSACTGGFACLCLCLTWPCYLVCRIN